MIRHVVPDFLHVAGELVTGKSVVVLLGVTRLALDRRLACAALLLGAFAGAAFSVWSMHATTGLGALGLGNRGLQLAFSLFLSLSLLTSVSGGALVPAFCLVAQSLPERASTGLVALLLSLAFHFAALSTELAPARHRGPDAGGDWGVLARTLQLAALAFYGSVHHGPAHALFGPGRYCTPVIDRHLGYTCFVFFTGTWLRTCIWLQACFLQNNPMHVLFEGERPGEWAPGYLLSVALLYQACWTATQLREQVLPYFGSPDPLRLLALVLSLAALWRHGAHWPVFYAADALAALSVLTAVRTLRRVKK